MDHSIPRIVFYRVAWNTWLKRVFEILLCTAAVCLCLPLWVFTYIIIRIDSPGPVLYRQRRLGYMGRPFLLYKFRTMHHHAEKDTGPVWATQNDQRVTRAGKWLRATHFDETLQFINVLEGNMSLIGPRPEREEIISSIEKNLPNYRKRLQVKPGITGLAQVFQNYDTCVRDVRNKLRYDMLYIRRRCANLDMKILFWTVLWVVQLRGK